VRSWKDDAAEQGVEADEAEHNGASQLNSSVLRTVGGATGVIGTTGRSRHSRFKQPQASRPWSSIIVAS